MNEEEKFGSIAQMEKELAELLRERHEIAAKTLGPDHAATVWYTARLRIIETKIHRLRNQIFISRNAL